MKRGRITLIAACAVAILSGVVVIIYGNAGHDQDVVMTPTIELGELAREEQPGFFEDVPTTDPKGHPGIDFVPTPEPPGLVYLETLQGGTIVLDGEWEYECNEDNWNVFTWQSYVYIKDERFVILAKFFDWNLTSIFREDLSIAFLLYEESVSHESFEALRILSNGELAPDMTDFRNSNTMRDYPGGYDVFEKDLKDSGINWKVLWEQLWLIFALMYTVEDTDDCLPPLRLDEVTA